MTDVKKGDVVQIDPEHDKVFGGCFLIVTEEKSWGVVGYVSIPQQGAVGTAYYRCPKEKFQRVGIAEWAQKDI